MPCDDCATPALIDLADVLGDQAHWLYMATGDQYQRGFADALGIIIDAGVSMQPRG
jgi:hypothetical protein